MVAHAHGILPLCFPHPNSVKIHCLPLRPFVSRQSSGHKRSIPPISSSAESSTSICPISSGSILPNSGLATAASSMGAEVVAQDAGPVKCTVVKSPSDEREYEVVHLPNGLCALLVHDPKISGFEGRSNSDGSGSEDDAGASDEEEDSEEDDEDGEDDEADEDEDDEDEDMDHCETCQENGSCVNHNHSGDIDPFGEGGSRMKVAVKGPGSTKKMAAAALAVGVGSFSDPKDAQGLAHFLEHMLFMGSSKFPDENEYDNFLSKHGGSSNAFTDTERTCYYFEVNHKFLKPALDRFSQFFISPLVKAEAMEREVQAVDSEFEGHLQSDVVRLSQLQCNTAHQRHPFNCFSWGNRKSLSEPAARGVDMRNKLLKMYNDHYLAGRMKLTVIGGEPLETLREWVKELFSEVRGGGQKQLSFPWEGPVWESGKMYCVKSVKDQHYLSIIWPFPCLDDAYLKKPQDYISHLIGHEGAGSLLSVLKLEGWATELTAGVGEGGFERCSSGYMFNIIIHLTDSGLGKVEEVVGLLYQYLKMLRSTGPQEWVFKELQAMTKMEFKFVEEEHPDDYAVSIATNMHLYPENLIIYGDYALEKWDPELVQSLLDCLVPQNMRLDLVTKSFDLDASGVQHEPWFGVPYTIEDISCTLMELWADPPHINSMLHMPVVNEFIPSDFSIREAKGVVTDVPRILVDEPSVKVWYKLDQNFKMPRANAYFLITCTGAYDSAKAAVLTELYVRLIKDALNETLYLANVARLESSLSVAFDKLEIKIHGFNEKLPTLASKISYLLKHFVPAANRFQVIKEELEREYKNTNMKPLKHATYLRLQILKERFWHVDDKASTLSSLSLEDLKFFILQLLSQTHIEALCHGNLYEEEAITIASIFKGCLVIEPLPTALEPKDRILILPSGTSLIYNENAKNVMEENSVVEMYFQLEQDLGQQTVRARAIYDLVETIIYEPFFNELRTKEQLGYTVDCSARLTNRILGFCFRVQSSKFSPPYLKQRIDAFIDSLQSLLLAPLYLIGTGLCMVAQYPVEALSCDPLAFELAEQVEGIGDDEFKNYVEALIAVKLESDHSLAEETDRYWGQIIDRRYVFDIDKLEAEELRRISKLDVVEWYKTFLHLNSSNRKKLSIFVWGSNARSEEASKDIGSLADVSVEAVDIIQDLSVVKLRNEYFPPLC